jgi:hypothetical protein
MVDKPQVPDLTPNTLFKFLMEAGRPDLLYELQKQVDATTAQGRELLKMGTQVAELAHAMQEIPNLTRAIQETNATLRILCERLK